MAVRSRQRAHLRPHEERTAPVLGAQCPRPTRRRHHRGQERAHPCHLVAFVISERRAHPWFFVRARLKAVIMTTIEAHVASRRGMGMLRHRLLVLVLPLLAVSAATACGDDSEGAPGSISVEPQVDQLATAVCDLAFRCCGSGEIGWYLGPWINAANCVDRFVQHASLSADASIDLQETLGTQLQVPNVGALSRAVSDGRTKVDAEALQACVDYLQGVECNQFRRAQGRLCPAGSPLGNTPCDPELIFLGTLGKNARCSSSLGSLECKTGLVCRTDGELGAFGQCVPVSQVNEPCTSDGGVRGRSLLLVVGRNLSEARQEGETCLFADRDYRPHPATALIECRKDLSCDPLTDTCVVACQRGAKCTLDEQCDDTQELTCILGRCDARRATGLPCGSDDDCQDKLFCFADPLNPGEICTEHSPLGTACQAHSQCASGFCDPTAGHCAAPVPPGTLCPSGSDAQCDQGRCVSEQLLCTTDGDCPTSGKCDLSTSTCASYCVELLPDGAACVSDSDCDSEACVADFLPHAAAFGRTTVRVELTVRVGVLQPR